jgi:hypothetical protein
MAYFDNLKKNLLVKEDEVFRENISKCNQMYKSLNECEFKTVDNFKKLICSIQELLYLDHFKHMYRNNKVIFNYQI